jgi:phage shock protein A
VYEQVIRERTHQYVELKRAVAGILYMRNKLEAEIRERRSEVALAQQDIQRAVERGSDDVALELISQKDLLAADLHRSETELEEVVTEAESAKGNLVKFRGEIQALEREKVRMMAVLANARARKRIQESLDGLSLEGEMKALENVREQISRLRTEGNLTREMGDTGLQTRIREIREETRLEGSRRELEELKRRLRPGSQTSGAIEAPAADPAAAAAPSEPAIDVAAAS